MSFSVDEAWDSVLLVESNVYSKSLNEGVAAGQQRDLRQGFVLGLNRGWTQGQEVGQFLGLAQTHLRILERTKDLSKKQKQALSTLKKLEEEALAFSALNEKSEGRVEQLQSLRAKAKKIEAILGSKKESKKEEDHSW